LFIVDGVILDNSTIDETSNGGSSLGLASDRPNRNNDYSNRISDLNPSDIESVTVLKGPGQQHSMEARQVQALLLLQRKKLLPEKLVLYDNSFRVQSISRYADLNNDFGPGNNGVPSNSYSTVSFTYYGQNIQRELRNIIILKNSSVRASLKHIMWERILVLRM
jgi:hypothetical protein